MNDHQVSVRDELELIFHRLCYRAILGELEAFVEVARVNPWRDVTADDVGRWLPRFREADKALVATDRAGARPPRDVALAYRDAWHAMLGLAGKHPRLRTQLVDFKRSGEFRQSLARLAEELQA